MSDHAPVPALRRRLFALAVVSAMALTGCDALGGGGTEDATGTPGATSDVDGGGSASGGGSESGGGAGAVADGPTTLPEPGEVVATTTSRTRPGLELRIREPVQYDDGTVRLAVDVVNQSNEDVGLSSALPFSGRRMSLRLVDPPGPSRHWPVTDPDENRCLCSGYDDGLTVLSGATMTVEAIYDGMQEGLESVRVEAWEYAPVDDVAVRQEAAPAPTAGGATVPVVGNPDLEVAMESVQATADGTVARLRLTNVGAAQPVELSAFPTLDRLHLVDLAARDSYGRVEVEGEFVSTLPEEPEPIAVGQDLAVDVLFPTLAPSATAVSLGSPGLPLGPPVTIGQGETPDGLGLPTSTDEPTNYELASQAERYDTPLVGLADAERVPAEATGPSIPVPDVAGRLTSEAQPGWSIAVRGVVRGPGPLATVLMDMTDTGAERWWPQGLGVDDESNLGLVAVIDQAGGQRLEVFRSGTTALSAYEGEDDFSEDETNLVFALVPGLSADASTVSVDVPGFGRVDDVPVVDPTSASDTGDGVVATSMAWREAPGLRRDVLAVSRLGDGNGTLVRVRDVNADNPDTFDSPLEFDICELDLYDPASQRVFNVLDPCTGSTPAGRLGLGESLVHELRFPELPPDVEQVVVLGSGFLPSDVVAVTSGDLPWFAMLPDDAGESAGGVYAASVGPADGASIVREEDELVEVTLDNDVLFAFGSAELSPRANAVLQDVSTRIERDAVPGSIDVVGHTDSRGTDDANERLSLQRAQAVQGVLDRQLERPDVTLEVEGFGASEPVAPNEIEGRDNPDGRARNRRVTITYTVTQ